METTREHLVLTWFPPGNPKGPNPMKHAYDIYSDRCPTRAVLDRIADKWALLIMDRLSREPARFNVLKRDISGISQKVLSQTLKLLERDGLVSRTAFATVPVTVEYALTPLGENLTRAVATLCHWAESNMDAIHKAQLAYDRRARSALRA
jgi:DNA-binding HxlR family transcriptional regulator